MRKLPRISAKQTVKVLEKIGWTSVRQRGSHIIMTKPGSIYTLSIPNKPIVAPGLLKDLLNKADITIEKFIELLT